MTQMPPPPSMPYQPGMQNPYNQPARTNVAAVISLICGILGCMVITPIIAVITGIVGIVQAKTLKSGRGMAIAGLILGILWIVGAAGIFGSIAFVSHRHGGFVNWAVGAGTKQQMTVVLNNLADGNTAAVKPFLPVYTDDQLDALSAELKPLGHVKDISFSSFVTNTTNGQVSSTYAGTITFENGTRDFDASGGTSGNALTINKLELK